ncbi:MAG TPA: glycosyltransferase family 39 protein [Deltaproteobacteria bacterium]|nr:glycosyltransferase family 39 protein [Deltaproteobacteria bacterium]HQB39461.1 glycosyltransferase family 39 protein [Deltaproteobacteria bacterium]
MAALGDRIGGLAGARSVGILFGLGLTVALFGITRSLFTDAHANTAAILTVISSTYIYLSKLATYDIVSACFLAISFWLLVTSKQNQAFKALALAVASSLFLFLAAITKYAVAIFAISLMLYFITTYRNPRIMVVFTVTLLTLSAAYAYVALLPIHAALQGSVSGVYAESSIPARDIMNWALRWLSVPGVLVPFAFARSPYRREIVILSFMSIPLIVLHLATGASQSINKNIIFSFIFMTPAAAVGLHCMSDVFSGDSGKSMSRYFFAAILIIVLWAFGIQDLRWLEKQYPDMRPVMNYIASQGHSNMQLVIDSDFGNATYAYSLAGLFPGATFESISEYQARRALANGNIPLPDYIILDDYHQKIALRELALQYIGKGGYLLEKSFTINMSWGNKNVSIYRRTS